MKSIFNIFSVLSSISIFTQFELVFSQPALGQLPGISCSDVRPLISWYSPSRGDNFATTMPLWGGPIGVQRSPDYRAYRNEGYVFLSQRSGTIPLYRFYFPAHGDNWTTSDPRYAPDTLVFSDNFRFSRFEGYIYDPSISQPVNTLPLDNSWSQSRADRFISSDPIWTGELGKPNSPDYNIFRREGYILNPENFTECDHEINENGTLPDFAITNINRTSFGSLLITIKNTGASGYATHIECSFSGNKVSREINFRLSMDGFVQTFIRSNPPVNQAVTCSVEGVNISTSEKEPIGKNNSLTKIPTPL